MKRLRIACGNTNLEEFRSVMKFCITNFGEITVNLDPHGRTIVSIFLSDHLDSNPWYFNITPYYYQFFFNRVEDAVFFKLHFPEYVEF